VIRPADPGRVPGRDRQPHRAGHLLRIGRAGNGRRDEDPGAAKFHRERRVAGGADPGVEDDGDPGPLDDHRDVVRVADAESRADRGAERHHRRAPRGF